MCVSSPGYSIATNCQMALPERIHHQHLVQTGSSEQHQCGQRQAVPLLVSRAESHGYGILNILMGYWLKTIMKYFFWTSLEDSRSSTLQSCQGIFTGYESFISLPILLTQRHHINMFASAQKILLEEKGNRNINCKHEVSVSEGFFQNLSQG